MAIIWEEPPAEARIHHRQGTIGEWLTALKARPGKWARMNKAYENPTSARSTAGVIRNGNVKGFRKGEFEAVAHEGKVWARYVKDGVDEGDAGDDGSADEDARRAFPPKVRAWAKLNGINVKPGRLPDAVVQRYVEATGDELPASRLQAVE